MSWSWSYGNWIYNCLCNQCLSPLKLWVRIPRMARCTRYNIVIKFVGDLRQVGLTPLKYAKVQSEFHNFQGYFNVAVQPAPKINACLKTPSQASNTKSYGCPGNVLSFLRQTIAQIVQWINVICPFARFVPNMLYWVYRSEEFAGQSNLTMLFCCTLEVINNAATMGSSFSVLVNWSWSDSS